MRSGIVLLALSLGVIAPGGTAVAFGADVSPRAVVDELLAADRAFAATSAGTDLVSGISAQLDENAVMLAPKVNFARGKPAIAAALRENPANVSARADWTPVRGGVSADGLHGFTFGYMTIEESAKPPRFGKYVSYWIKRPEGWRVAVYKRAGRPAGDVPLAAMEPALPAKIVGASNDSAAVAAYRTSLDQAERGFSDEAQVMGIGPAFKKNGSADAVNMGVDPAFIVGADAIGTAVAGPNPAPGSPVSWKPDDVIVASSGDLGVTWGLLRANGPVPEGQPDAVPYLTVWRRANPSDPWRYVAE